MKNSLEIAQEAELQPISEIGERLGLEPEEIEPYGRYKSKISLAAIDRLADRPDGKLVCVAGMTPTRAGEGKTTTSVALTEGMGHIGTQPGPVSEGAVAGPGVRDQGRGRRGRVRPGRPDGGPQPPLHRGHPRDRRRQQPARGDPRRLDPARQPTPRGCAPGHLEARGRHERPRAAQGHDRPRRPRQRLSARDRLRHHRRVGGDGDPRRGPRRPGPRAGDWAGSPSPTRARASRSPPRT